MTDKNLSMFVVDTDWGVGVITKGSQVLFPKTKMLDYKLLDENRTELLNLISPEKFLTL
jgi:hypothetical protein